LNVLQGPMVLSCCKNGGWSNLVVIFTYENADQLDRRTRITISPTASTVTRFGTFYALEFIGLVTLLFNISWMHAMVTRNTSIGWETFFPF